MEFPSRDIAKQLPLVSFQVFSVCRSSVNAFICGIFSFIWKHFYSSVFPGNCFIAIWEWSEKHFRASKIISESAPNFKVRLKWTFNKNKISNLCYPFHSWLETEITSSSQHTHTPTHTQKNCVSWFFHSFLNVRDITKT